MHKITFYPIGNADCCKIDLENGKKLLFDFAHTGSSEDDNDPRIDLAKTINAELKAENRNYFDVVGFTHGHSDHVLGAADFFYFEHAKKYQDENRIKINELWVPAAMIIDDGAEDDYRVIRQEARYRLKAGKGIRVFSRPDRLKSWLESNDLKLEDRKDLITDAGQLVPGLSLDNDEVEFFTHSPFAVRADEGSLEDKNEHSLIFHVTFLKDNYMTKFMLIGDTDHEVLKDIVNITKYHNREERLEWDIYDIPHHCSYLALNSEKGKNKTTPIEEIDWLLSNSNNGFIMVATCKPIPNEDTDQPPHRQAAKCYKSYLDNKSGQFVVTMEHPNEKKPEPVVITIDRFGAKLKKTVVNTGTGIASRPAPRAGVR